MKKSRAWIALSVLAAVLLSSVGCHTAGGFGKDMQSGGRAIRREVRDAKN